MPGGSWGNILVSELEFFAWNLKFDTVLVGGLKLRSWNATESDLSRGTHLRHWTADSINPFSMAITEGIGNSQAFDGMLVHRLNYGLRTKWIKKLIPQLK